MRTHKGLPTVRRWLDATDGILPGLNATATAIMNGHPYFACQLYRLSVLLWEGECRGLLSCIDHGMKAVSADCRCIVEELQNKTYSNIKWVFRHGAATQTCTWSVKVTMHVISTGDYVCACGVVSMHLAASQPDLPHQVIQDLAVCH